MSRHRKVGSRRACIRPQSEKRFDLLAGVAWIERGLLHALSCRRMHCRHDITLNAVIQAWSFLYDQRWVHRAGGGLAHCLFLARTTWHSAAWTLSTANLDSLCSASCTRLCAIW